MSVSGHGVVTPRDRAQAPPAPTRAEAIENAASLVVLAIMAMLPLAEIAWRLLRGGGIPGTIPIVQHMTLWITFLGACLAARSDRLLALATSRNLLPERWRVAGRVATSALAVGVVAALTWASLDLVRTDREFGDRVAWGIPLWAFSAVMPLGFAIIGARIAWRAGASDQAAGASDQRPGAWLARAAAAAGALLPLLCLAWPEGHARSLAWVVGILLLFGAALGTPIFAVIGGLALVLYHVDMTPLSAVPGETYRLATSPMLPAIPLFTIGGYLLAEGGSGRRLMRLFTALFGWLPGGLAIVIVALLAFFTPLTGASGITIVSMGGLLLPMLIKSNYSDRTALGLVTVSGSIGLLFPPSLPVILYAYCSELPVADLFRAGVLPGALMVVSVAGWGALSGIRSGATRSHATWREMAAAAWGARFELALPIVVAGSVFGGFCTLVEASALTVVYAFIVECLVFRELHLVRDLPRVATEAATLVGGFMIILSVALGLTGWLILAEVPAHALTWMQAHVHSPIVFLLALNLLLIVVGAVMDIYSATLVIVPLILPIGAAYGIDPLHLGIIFLANMELGYLMPPMGENLFLSAYRFNRPITAVYRSTIPYLVILAVTVLLITYFPPLTLWLVGGSD